MVQPQEGWQHGCRTGWLQGPKKGIYFPTPFHPTTGIPCRYLICGGDQKVIRVIVPQRENAIVNRLNKTKIERTPDLRQERDDRQKELRKRDQAAHQQRVSPLAEPRLFRTSPSSPGGKKKEEALIAKERQEKKWQKDHAYDELFSEENMATTSNQDRDMSWEDDFM